MGMAVDFLSYLSLYPYNFYHIYHYNLSYNHLQIVSYYRPSRPTNC